MAAYPKNSLPIGDYRTGYSNPGPAKPGISSYLDNTISKPSLSTSLGTNNVFGSSSSNSNFPKKIVAKRDSQDESTRNDTTFPKSSFLSKVNDGIVSPFARYGGHGIISDI